MDMPHNTCRLGHPFRWRPGTRTETHLCGRSRVTPTNDPQAINRVLNLLGICLKFVAAGPKIPSKMDSSALVRALFWATLISVILASDPQQHACAQMVDSFEGGAPRFQLVESDCQAQLPVNEISNSLPHSGQTCESMEILCGNGTYAYLAAPVEPSAIIDELAPSIWVQCMSGRIRLGANVVFPNATHPVTGGRLHSILWGTTYDQPGQWQRLTLSDSEKMLQQEVALLRQRFGPKVNFDGAYIDSLVLNAYTGPGRYRIKLDDLTLQGLIPISSLGQPVAMDWRIRWRWRDGANTEEQRWTQSQSSRIPVWWQYQGESMPWLRSLGFTGLLFNRVPSDALLSEARSARLNAISPPPSQSLALDEELWSTVKGWMVGAAVDGRGLEALNREVDRVNQFDEAMRRPTLAEAMEEYWAFSRVVDELIVPVPSNMSAGATDEKLRWLMANLRDSSRRGSGWVSIATDPLPSWQEQVRQVQKIVEPTGAELDTTDAVQMRMQVAGAVASGARGFLFRSASPLDISSSDQKVRVAAMRTIHRDLALIGPWISGGQIAPIPKVDREDYAVAAWTASRSHLVMFVNNSPDAQHCVPPTRDRPLTARMPLPSGIHNVLRVTNGNVQSLLLTPGAEGLSWEIRDPGPVEFCILTDNPLVERYVTRQTSPTTATESAEDSLDIASHQLQLASRLTAARWPAEMDELPRRYLRTIAAGQERIEQGYQELRANRPSRAVDAAAQAYDAAQMIVYESYQTAKSGLATPQSSPLVLAPATLPYHWMLARSCDRSKWRDLPLPGNEFANLDAMLQNGWTQQRRLDDRAEMLVELVPGSEDATRGAGLRLAAVAKRGQPLPGGYEGATIRVRSSPSQAAIGELVRITGRAVVRVAPADPGAGLLVYDNKGGPALGQLVRGAPGEVVPIELYRFVTDESPLRVLTELRGACDIVLEDLRLSAIQPAVNQVGFQTTYEVRPAAQP